MVPALELYVGLCNRSASIIMTALKAILHNSDSFVHISSIPIVFRMKIFPALLDSGKKMFSL